MKTLRKLKEKQLDKLEDRINAQLRVEPCCTPSYDKKMKKLWKIMNERLRRVGL